MLFGIRREKNEKLTPPTTKKTKKNGRSRRRRDLIKTRKKKIGWGPFFAD